MNIIFILTCLIHILIWSIVLLGFLNKPADMETALLPDLLKKILAQQLLQKPLFALLDDLYHLRVFFDLKTIFSSSTEV